MSVGGGGACGHCRRASYVGPIPPLESLLLVCCILPVGRTKAIPGDYKVIPVAHPPYGLDDFALVICNDFNPFQLLGIEYELCRVAVRF